jgi:predicted nucleic acid-binding protein
MRVLVDTSVWADFFNGAPTTEAETLSRLIVDEVEVVTCGVVIAEFFQGIRQTKTLQTLEGHFRDMECLSPKDPDTYFAAADLYRELRAKGVTIRSTIDCVIARIAFENDVLLLARDVDLKRILDSSLSGAKGLPG